MLKSYQWKAILLMAVIGLPVILFFVVRSVSHSVYHFLPVKYSSISQGDTVFYGLPSIKVVDYQGKPFDVDEMKGSICVVNFIAPTQDSIFFRIATGMLKKSVYDNALGVQSIRLLSFVTDSLAGKDFAPLLDRYKMTDERWRFIPASSQTAYSIAQNLYSRDTLQSLSEKIQPFNLSIAALIDKKGRVRGYYNVMQEQKSNGMKGLREDLRALILLEYKDEYKRP